MVDAYAAQPDPKERYPRIARSRTATLPPHLRVDDPFPNVDLSRLRELWEEHRPTFVKVDDDESLLINKVIFLTWLQRRGISPSPKQQRAYERIKLLDVSTVRLAENDELQVHLSHHGMECVGRVPTIAHGEAAASAWATIDAVKQLSALPLTLEQVVMTGRRSGESIPLIAVVIRDPSRPDVNFVGAHVLEESVSAAAAKAVLKGINRYWEMAHSEGDHAAN